MNGRELKAKVDAADLTPEQVCSEAVVSISSLYKIYSDKHVSPRTRSRVEQAVQRLLVQMAAPASATG